MTVAMCLAIPYEWPKCTASSVGEGDNTGSQYDRSEQFRRNPSLLVEEPGHLKRFGTGRPVHSVDEVDSFPDVKTFFTDYVLASKPLVIRGGAKQSKAYRDWSDDYFLSLELTGDSKVLVETKKKEDRNQPTVDMHFQEFVRTYNDTDRYMVAHVPRFLKDDVPLPRSLNCDQIYESNFVDAIMWYSSGGTKSVVHTDSVDNLNCLFRGEKSFFMVDPHRFGEYVDIDQPGGAYSDIDVDKMDYTKYPGLAQVEYHNIDMVAGDCLYIPFKWIHQVRSYNRNIAINIWWDHYRNRDVELDACPEHPDSPLTLASVSFQGFDDMEETLDGIRDHFTDFVKRKPLDFDGLLGMLAEDVEFLDSVDAGQGYMVPIQQIFNLLDANEDGILDKKDIADASDEVMGEVRKEMRQFGDILAALEERWLDLNEDYDEEANEWEPDSNSYGAEDDYHDEF